MNYQLGGQGHTVYQRYLQDNNPAKQFIDKNWIIDYNDNFIMTIDNFMSSDDCQFLIDLFHKFNGHGYASNRDEQTTNKLWISDDSITVGNQSDTIDLANTCEEYGIIIKQIWRAYEYYNDKWTIVFPPNRDATDLYNFHMKVQKTEPGGGYHIWHYEQNKEHTRRVLAWGIYLNDIKEGGETEFLYQSYRAKPKTGRLVMWPAGFTHMHRGNPPIGETKWLATGWITY